MEKPVSSPGTVRNPDATERTVRIPFWRTQLRDSLDVSSWASKVVESGRLQRVAEAGMVESSERADRCQGQDDRTTIFAETSE
jgi:hypothetical protein